MSSVDPYAPPGWASPPGPETERAHAGASSRRADARAGALTALVVLLLGAPVGLLWGALSPRVQVVMAGAGPDLVSPEGKGFIAADGWFFLLTAAAGLLCGVAAWLLGRRHGLAVPVGLAVGGVLAALVAWKVGHRVGYADFAQFLKTARAGSTHAASIDVRAKGVLVGWALAATVGFGVLTAFFDRDPR